MNGGLKDELHKNVCEEELGKRDDMLCNFCLNENQEQLN